MGAGGGQAIKDRIDEIKLFCPITGLQIYTQDGWHRQKLSNNFTANLYIIGRSVLYSAPSGMADIDSARSVLRLTGEMAEKVAGGTEPYIQIEDYASFTNATIEARKHFIEQMISRDRVVTVIFCNLLPLMNLFVKKLANDSTPQERISTQSVTIRKPSKRL